MPLRRLIDPTTKKHMLLRVFDNDIYRNKGSVPRDAGEFIVAELQWSRGGIDMRAELNINERQCLSLTQATEAVPSRKPRRERQR